MHVISASRRTDIPAFYAPWFMNRIRAGYCLAQNPFSRQEYRVSLDPTDVIALLFWTRDPRPLLPHLGELERRGYRCTFGITITGYDRTLDAAGPDPEPVIDAFRRLAERIGPEFVQWRYDPILLTERLDAEYHRRAFARFCAALEGCTRRCLISFLQLYKKNRGRMEAAAARAGCTYAYIPMGGVAPAGRGRVLPVEEMRDLACDLGRIAAGHGIQVQSCCNDLLVSPLANVHKAHCVDRDLIARLRPDLRLDLEARPTRGDCGCFASRDIGAYDTCAHACAYCYATRDPAAARAAQRRHDPGSERL